MCKTLRVEIRGYCICIPRDHAETDQVFEVSWNVAGLRSLLEKRPDRLAELLKTEEPRVLGLIEHKLQVALLLITGKGIEDVLRSESFALCRAAHLKIIGQSEVRM